MHIQIKYLLYNLLLIYLILAIITFAEHYIELLSFLLKGKKLIMHKLKKKVEKLKYL